MVSPEETRMLDIWPVERNEGYVLRAAYWDLLIKAWLRPQIPQIPGLEVSALTRTPIDSGICSYSLLLHLGKSFQHFKAKFSHIKMWEAISPYCLLVLFFLSFLQPHCTNLGEEIINHYSLWYIRERGKRKSYMSTSDVCSQQMGKCITLVLYSMWNQEEKMADFFFPVYLLQNMNPKPWSYFGSFVKTLLISEGQERNEQLVGISKDTTRCFLNVIYFYNHSNSFQGNKIYTCVERSLLGWRLYGDFHFTS